MDENGATGMALDDELLDAARTALIDSTFPSRPDLRPKLLSNDIHRGRKVVSSINSELSKCSSFDFSVAFITQGGIEPLLQTLRELEKKGVPGRVITTDYLAFSEPNALEKLDSLKNIEVRMYRTINSPNQFGFHTKGYLFAYPNGLKKALVGSSNMTQSALSVNREWNLELSSLGQGGLVQDIQIEFEDLWEKSVPLSEIIDLYRTIHDEKKQIVRQETIVSIDQIKLEPNSMQLGFIASLDDLIARGASRALLISATGTGKTYASAFAMRHLDPKRVLFLAHREQVLKQAKKSYAKVLGHTKTYGLLSGNSHDFDSDYLFATMQTMSQDSWLKQFKPWDFDVIIVDEVHRAGSASYQKIIDYFKPRLYLGMTATPERPDSFDIYGLFDNEIAYEIRLQDALENNLLCPFHYFGITDLEVDGKPVDDLTEVGKLVSDERVDYIIEQAEYYDYSGERVKGLAFCKSLEEAVALSNKFNERGYKTKALSGDTPQDDREDAIDRLTNDSFPEDLQLDYLFTVDIFNEGVDIPQVNQVLMLRPTKSPIVFVQQLGRGLRQSDNKEFVVVLDFIGNYTNNYLIPIALSGDRTYNKDSIRKYVMEGDRVIPGSSSIHFDEISRERIFESIDQSRTSLAFFRQKYNDLKHKLGRIPFMLDFQKYGEVDPMLFVNQYKSYYRFLVKVEPEYRHVLTEDEQLTLEYVSRYFGNGMRPHEILVMKKLLRDEPVSQNDLQLMLKEQGIGQLDERSFLSTTLVLDKSFMNQPPDRRSYEKVNLIETDGDTITCSSGLHELLEHALFKAAMIDILDCGLVRYREKYAVSDHGLTLYEKYMRKDVLRLLNWELDESMAVMGYRVKHNTCPIFVTYNKSDVIARSTQYADEFVSPRVFSWMTRSNRTLSSPEVRQIINGQACDLDIRLFIKKSDNEGSDFYYLGRVKPFEWRETKQENNAGELLDIVNIKFELEHTVPDDLYEYFGGPEVSDAPSVEALRTA